MDVLKKIYDYSLEDIMGESFGRYAKTIIQDRALPDVRDGLKPVQRRILYGMYKDGNTYDKPTKKSAKAVGNIMGYYHPHGDSSIYDALVRMSQWWKNNICYVEMQGNNGSMDGDGAAAMRYTEARLTKVAGELLKDIDKDTVLMSLNYDDTILEPTVLPAKFPNLLVNGSTGISAGYATNIPPHNLSEVIDATIKRIDNPNCHLETIMDIVKGPDFPTGAIAEGIDGIKQAFETGRGKINICSRYKIEKNNGKKQIVISEIPYEVNKAMLVKKIDEIRIEKKVEGISEVRDETDRNGLQITIDLKKNANEDLIVNYLLKNTDMMVSYNYNMVAIVNRRPETLGILAILDAYIAHQKDFIIKRTKFDLKHAKERMHIVEGLIKALSILDDVIRVIRASKNRADAVINLQNEFEFTKLQAEAIVVLQLYKLTNTDVNQLEEELKKLREQINIWTQIIENKEALKHVMKTELRLIKKEYGTERKTTIKTELTDVKIDNTSLIPKEDCIVVITNEGYIKRVSLRSYTSSDDETGLKDKDFVLDIYKANTMDTILLFTDKGNFLYVPVYEIPDLKWKDLGKHISNIVNGYSDNIVSSYHVKDFNCDLNIISFTKKGMVKLTKLKDFKVQRYNKPITFMKLKDDDIIINAEEAKDYVITTTNNGFGLRYKVDELSATGLRTSGVKSINLKDDFVTSAHSFKDELYLLVVTDKNSAKRIKLELIDNLSRARKGVGLIRKVKTNPYHIINSFVISKCSLGIITDETTYIKSSDILISDRNTTGSNISQKQIENIFIKKQIEEEKETDMSLEQIDQKILTIDDFLDDFNEEGK